MDDEEIVRKVAYELLTGLGHDVEAAAHGDEAIAKYRQAIAEGRPFDIVILDLTIRGGMGGAEAMKRLREIDPRVKAIVSSGYSNDSVVANYRDHAFAAFLKKPYDLTDLKATLNALLGLMRTRSRDDPGTQSCAPPHTRARIRGESAKRRTENARSTAKENA